VKVGAHTPGGDPLGEAEAREADLVQIFLSNPQSWRKPAPRDDADRLRNSPIPIYVHAPYLINVCADNNRVRIPSRKILQETCDAAEEIAAAAVIVHGGHVTGDSDISEGFLRWRKALDQVDTSMQILIENTAGGDVAVARRLDALARLWGEIGEMGVGFVLDTCHAWAGGEPMDELVEHVLDATGRVDLLHLNDSRDPFDSRRDRHANLGAGEMLEDDLATVIRAVDCPVVVETPGGAAQQAADIAWARRVAG
jgi:deoxyribonuclease IV